ncbi:unnamed protein product [Heterotrigona itama]|uniref:PiggyBac transposable element-derived protein domain-containing protein n=1 Tax=Heterotrigona itama TaxID=395501 RepID=A0A6V7H1N8_9HYME|nr:unnamed protein product [Heterotrigona itama]
MIEAGRINYITGSQKLKPECIADYNIKMCSVNRVDMTSHYNSYVLSVTGKKLKYNDFHLSLIKQILQKYPQNRKQAGGGKRKHRKFTISSDGETFPFENFKCSRQHNKKKMCCLQEIQKKRSDSPYECKKCDIGLCVDNCFEIYHTQMNY